jgi:hypothetical protein
VAQPGAQVSRWDGRMNAGVCAWELKGQGGKARSCRETGPRAGGTAGARCGEPQGTDGEGAAGGKRPGAASTAEGASARRYARAVQEVADARPRSR